MLWSLEQAKVEGLVMEFGVWSGKSIRLLAAQTTQPVYGFDSFEGLPERWRDGYDAGHFKVQSPPEVPNNVELVKGWFNETLPPFLEVHREPIRFLHVDCDLYSSTQSVLECCKNQMVTGTVILFDEYFNYPGWQDGEHRALVEFSNRHQIHFRYIAYNKFHEQMAIEISR